MQAIGLATDDDFLVRFNMSIDANDVVHYIRNLTFNWSQKNLFHEMFFDEKFGIYLNEVVGPPGLCLTFNIIDADELFYLEK